MEKQDTPPKELSLQHRQYLNQILTMIDKEDAFRPMRDEVNTYFLSVSDNPKECVYVIKLFYDVMRDLNPSDPQLDSAKIFAALVRSLPYREYWIYPYPIKPNDNNILFFATLINSATEGSATNRRFGTEYIQDFSSHQSSTAIFNSRVDAVKAFRVGCLPDDGSPIVIRLTLGREDLWTKDIVITVKDVWINIDRKYVPVHATLHPLKLEIVTRDHNDITWTAELLKLQACCRMMREDCMNYQLNIIKAWTDADYYNLGFWPKSLVTL